MAIGGNRIIFISIPSSLNSNRKESENMFFSTYRYSQRIGVDIDATLKINNLMAAFAGPFT
jgi:hypothetical protein